MSAAAQATPVTATRLRVGTRRSLLARTQTAAVVDALLAATTTAVAAPELELVEVLTRGDLSTAPLPTIGGTGVFVSALREALLEGRIDIAVHSLKDLPTAPAAGLSLAALPPRADPRDVLVARDRASLASLEPGARVGTGSPRRAAQIRAARPDLQVVDIRGNVDTRLRLVAEGRVDAVVLARAGLLRLGRADEASQILDPDVVLPAPGQGALAVECRDGDEATVSLLAVIDDAATRAAVTAERALLAALEAGCTAPVGALAVPAGSGQLTLRAVAAGLGGQGGQALKRDAITGPAGQAASLGQRLARRLLASGAAHLVPPAESAQ